MMDAKSKSEMIKIIHESEAFDKKADWFFVNRIWYRPDFREKFYGLLVNFWKQNLESVNEYLLICPEGLVSSFGIIPFASLLAHDMKYSMVIWKEYGDVLTASSLIYPDKAILQRGLNCILFQDVVSKGTMIQKMCNDLDQLKWKIAKHVTLIQIEKRRGELNKSFDYCRQTQNTLTDDFEFIYLLKDTDLI